VERKRYFPSSEKKIQILEENLYVKIISIFIFLLTESEYPTPLRRGAYIPISIALLTPFNITYVNDLNIVYRHTQRDVKVLETEKKIINYYQSGWQ